MQKKALLKRLEDIKKILKSDAAQGALEILQNEANHYEAPVSSKQNSSRFELPKEVTQNESAYALYTDGACRGNPGPGSYAYMIQNHKGEVISENADYSELTTNNKMELSAIIEGLKELKSLVTPMHSIYVFTDSKYAVDGMKSWVAGWKRRGWKKADKKAPENLDLWKSLDELQHVANVHFNWVKGHSGHPQNDHVDLLANEVLDKNGF